MNTSSEEHRRACEARHILTFTKQRRQAYYQGVEQKRGTKAAKELIAEVRRQYKLREQSRELELS